ncbi:MAG: hypothetical protein SVM86_07635 [Candidatus Cloacimonadota bacterium]|nr:hypothetical protein [Candidatus Cloacimonadota bacterium]
MNFKNKIAFIIAILLFLSIFAQEAKPTVSVFYKEKEPSQKVLAKVKSLLTDFQKNYQIEYFNIDKKENSGLIAEIGLPSEHFPFAVVIDKKFTAVIDGKIVSFVHFPIFMKGIGRHEGNWSLHHLKTVLAQPKLLYPQNFLPVLKEEATDCED